MIERKAKMFPLHNPSYCYYAISQKCNREGVYTVPGATLNPNGIDVTLLMLFCSRVHQYPGYSRQAVRWQFHNEVTTGTLKNSLAEY
jgi:hypothetical protein